MTRVTDPGVRDLLQATQSRRDVEAAEAALRRLLVGIEKGEAAAGGSLDSYSEALRRHGRTIHGEGSGALLRLAFDRLCQDVPSEVASRRFDLLSDAWASMLSKGGRP